jgi:small subunit ribosomal protein S2
MADVSMRRMLEAGVHFGHQTRFWNPQMSPYIFGERNKIHIINLEKTLPLYLDAVAFTKKIVADGGTVLFVGSKRAARQAIAEAAERCQMPHVSQRWLGGMLTNFKTIRQSIKRLRELETLTGEGSSHDFTKKEVLKLSRERDKLERALGGIKDMESLPDAVFVIDVGHEEIAVREAAKLEIPVIAVVDTNCSPRHVDYAIPGNDDAMSAIKLYAEGIADAVLDGKASIPDVPTGDDEFVELDDEGKPLESKRRRTKKPAKKKAKTTKVTTKPAAKAGEAEPKAEAAADAPEAEVPEASAPEADAPAADAPAADAPAADASEANAPEAAAEAPVAEAAPEAAADEAPEAEEPEAEEKAEAEK